MGSAPDATSMSAAAGEGPGRAEVAGQLGTPRNGRQIDDHASGERGFEKRGTASERTGMHAAREETATERAETEMATIKPPATPATGTKATAEMTARERGSSLDPAASQRGAQQFGDAARDDTKAQTKNEDEKTEQAAVDAKMTGGQQLTEAGTVSIETVLTLDATFEVLRDLMKPTGGTPAQAVWCERVADMFAMVYNSMNIKEKPQKADEDYPELDTGEATELFELFRRIVIVNKQPLATWRKSVSDVCRDLHRSSWSVTNLIRKYVDQARLEPNPTTSAWGRPRGSTPEKTTVTPEPKFAFHGGGFTTEKQATILEYCARSFEFPTTLREPTAFEWEIVLVMLEGKIIARHLPQFLRRVCDAENLLRFQRTIAAQVEGELVGQLNDNTPVYKDHQTSNRIVDAVMQATRHRGGNAERIFEMMKEIKAAVYNPATHALHFFFYNREVAARWNGLAVPFRMQMLKLVDVNAAAAGTDVSTSVWDRQLGSDGVQNAVTHSRYRVQLLNVSRFVEMHQLAAFLRIELGASFYAYSMDSGGPSSRHSLVWELLFEATICPSRLADVHRIFWHGHTILVHHVSRQRQPPCLGCGAPGHLVRNCKTTKEDMHSKNCITGTEVSTKELKCSPPTFRSAEETKEAFAESLRKNTKKKTVESASGAEQEMTTTKEPETARATGKTEPVGDETNGEQWKTKRGKKKNKKPKGTKTDGSMQQAPVEEADPATTDQQQQTGSKTKSGEQQTRGKPESEEGKSTQEEAEVSEEQTSIQSIPPSTQLTLITKDGHKWAKLLQKFRTKNMSDRMAEADAAKDLNPHTNEFMDEGAELSMEDLLESHGLAENATPATGNCQYYALAEAALQSSFTDATRTSKLERMTVELKSGIQAAALVHFALDFPPIERKDLLVRLNRYERGMDDKAMETAVIAFFGDVAKSPSTRTSVLPRPLWGPPEMLTMAAKAMQAPIFLVVENYQRSQVSYSVYEPTTKVFEGVHINTAGEFLLDRQDWSMALRRARAESEADGRPLPIVLKYTPEHYTSLLFTRLQTKSHASKFTSALQAEIGENELTPDMNSAINFNHNVREQNPTKQPPGTTTENTIYVDEEETKTDGNEESRTWEHEHWSGSTDNLQNALDDPAVAHHEKRQIVDIIAHEGDRKREPVAFQQPGVEQLSVAEQQAVSGIDLEHDPDVEQWMHRYGVSSRTLQQWQRQVKVLLSQTSTENQSTEVSGSLGTPSPSQASSGKREHETTPVGGGKDSLTC